MVDCLEPEIDEANQFLAQRCSLTVKSWSKSSATFK
jgi:hypothetical protein